MSSATEYQHVRHDALLTFQWTVQENEGDRELTASGTCPVCGCAMTWRIGPTQTVIPKGGFLGRREDLGPEPWKTSCRCESYHQPRPANARGCGAWLTLAPPPAHLTGGS
ncbi:hypothetical protein AB0D78_01210 [Streptomyces avermitilis]|uniref:hypothetical protein n=1 Tax=Streptomyces avermitilis TaxID=33903 RepID=UPI0033B5B55E